MVTNATNANIADAAMHATRIHGNWERPTLISTGIRKKNV